MSELIYRTANELAAMIRHHQASSVEVLEAHLAQIARRNPEINALVTLNTESALKRAREADSALARGEVWGVLHGVPVTIKDSLETAGIRTTSGFPAFADYVPALDATAVARVKAAGAVIMGKTNLPPLAADYQTDNPVFGRTNNPWDVSRTPGGSTGGGAAALAAGMTSLEIGSDIGGSVRNPAHFSGVCSIKPTDLLVSVAGNLPEKLPGAPHGRRHMAVVGPLARSVDDLLLTLPLIAGPDGRRWETPPVTLDAVFEPSLQSLRLAWTDDFGGLPVVSEIRADLARFADDLANSGCRVERTDLSRFDFPTIWETYGELYMAETNAALSPEMEARQMSEFTQAGFFDSSENPFTRGIMRGFNTSLRQYTALLERRDGLIGLAEQFFEQWDALICPAGTSPAIRHCKMGSPIDVEGNTVDYSSALGGYLIPFNLLGQPAVVIPLSRTSTGLPIGVQIVGKRWSDMRLLAIAKQLAEVTGGFQRPPGY